MQIQLDEQNGSRLVIVQCAPGSIANAGDALSLFMEALHAYNCNKLVVPKEVFVEEFFSLKTGLAGEILQKCSNYHICLAIVGDFSVYSSKSLRDFIFESNNGKQVLFLATQEQAVQALHGIA